MDFSYNIGQKLKGEYRKCEHYVEDWILKSEGDGTAARIKKYFYTANESLNLNLTFISQKNMLSVFF
jgi:hypothetical protein